MSKSILRCERLEDRDVPAAVGLFAVGTGEGALPRVAVYNAVNGTRIAEFAPYEPTFTGGVTVAMGDITADGVPELVVGAGPGGGPRVRVFNGANLIAQGGFFDPNNLSNIVADFFAFESSQRGGVFVTTGTFSGNLANAEIVVGAGPGGGPRVRVLDGTQIALQGRAYTSETFGDTIANFFAFEPSFRNGVAVAATQGTIGFSNLLTAPGFGGAARVRYFNGLAIANSQLNFTGVGPIDTLADFFAFSPDFRGGTYVTSADINSDGIFDIVAGTGPGVRSGVVIFNGAAVQAAGRNFTGGNAGDILDSFFAGPETYVNGVTVGVSYLNGPNDLLLVGAGDLANLNTTTVNQYETGSGFNVRRTLYSVSIDSTFRGRPNAGN